jgi:lipopolysaccharide/colanic/teichoic acid biosynthesis glycosyltransferase
MQTNPTIRQDTPAHNAAAGMTENIASTAPFDIASLEVEGFPPVGEFAVQDYSLPDISDRPYLSLVRNKAPYVLMPTYQKVLYDTSKRGIDIVGSVTLLLISLPLFLCVAILVRLTSKGPILFKHKRLGLHGNEFWLLKFRTMDLDAEERLKKDSHLRQQFAATYKIKGDPRITRCGDFLRKTSIDELPQLWHVLKGDMSLIGPRPIVTPELSKYAIYGKKLLTVKPGLSGFWQACGRSDTTYAERVLMDMQYIDHRCLSLDLRLLLLTVRAVIRKSGAC